MLFIESILKLIAPDDCLVCKDEGELLCQACETSELLAPPSACYACGASTRDFQTCVRCKKTSPLSAVWCCAVYDGRAAELIKRYKYDSARGGAASISRSMVRLLPMLDAVVTELPSDPARVRGRGFDHAKLLAVYVARQRELPYAKSLRRKKGTHQVGSNKAERRRQVNGLFSIEPSCPIHGKTILLIDDVMTTGASLEAAARVLKKSGARQIYGLIFAKTL